MTATKTRARPLPQRTCVACGTTTNKRELVRIVRTADGVLADPTGKLAGRGAYICHQPQCWEQAIKKGRLERSLKTTLTATDAAGLREYATSLTGGEA
ncbi:MAG: YlxR family protein [Dehalococcoidia bacterium]